MFVTKVKIAAMIMLTAGVLAAGGVVTHHALAAAPPTEKEQPAQPPKSAPKGEVAPASAEVKIPRELLKQRLEAAQMVYKVKLERVRGGQGLPVELLGWSERWVEAEMALTDKKADQVAALKAHVERTREMERLLIGYAKTGMGMESDAAAGTYERSNAEIRYFQATGEMLPPSPKIKKAIKEGDLREPLGSPQPQKKDDRP